MLDVRLRPDAAQAPTSVAALDDLHQLLALVEAQVGSLVELLPVPVLVASATGEILRANTAAADLLEQMQSPIGQRVDVILQWLQVPFRVRMLRSGSDCVLVYVLSDGADVARPSEASSRRHAHVRDHPPVHLLRRRG
jgi:PAS domain-containing protein